MQLEDCVKEQEEMTQTLVTKLECAIHASVNLTERYALCLPYTA